MPGILVDNKALKIPTPLSGVAETGHIIMGAATGALAGAIIGGVVFGSIVVALFGAMGGIVAGLIGGLMVNESPGE